MKVIMFTYWQNAWVPYLRKYFDKIDDIDFEVIVDDQLRSDKMMKADITIFAWADPSVIQATKYFMKLSRKYIVFCRSYEIFFGHIHKINWKLVDDCIFVNPSFAREYGNSFDTRVHYLANAIDIDAWELQLHKDGFDIAMVANLNHKKGIDMIPQFMHKICQYDKRYTLHIAGQDQEHRHTIHIKHLIKDLGLEDNVKFYGKIKGIQEWLSDKDYLFTCSVTEGHPNNVLEAMALGIKPLIHNWRGAKEQFPNHLVWSTIDEAVNLIIENKYDNEKYRNFIEENYSIDKVYPALERIIRNV